MTSIRTYPNGDLNMNPLHMLLGWEAYELAERLGPEGAYREAHRRMLAHWHLLQTRFGFDDWKLVWVSPMLGVRETHRLSTPMEVLRTIWPALYLAEACKSCAQLLSGCLG
ncbi:MAG: hypothetical protein HY332_05005, partial [Chloroflexi bacterium]|nr:hypothetical protein [Chloroflexota bacterium]